jgi:hypothetical protein
MPGILGGSNAEQNTGIGVSMILEPALTEIEIALRKEENPSKNVQRAIERINRLQGEMENTVAKPQCLCETCCMTVEQCRGQQLRQADSERDAVLDEISVRAKRLRAGNFVSEKGENNILDWIIGVCEEPRQQAGKP